MTEEEIKARIYSLENKLFWEEMKDSGYNVHFVRRCENEIAELKAELERLEENK